MLHVDPSAPASEVGPRHRGGAASGPSSQAPASSPELLTPVELHRCSYPQTCPPLGTKLRPAPTRSPPACGWSIRPRKWSVYHLKWSVRPRGSSTRPRCGALGRGVEQRSCDTPVCRDQTLHTPDQANGNPPSPGERNPKSRDAGTPKSRDAKPRGPGEREPRVQASGNPRRPGAVTAGFGPRPVEAVGFPTLTGALDRRPRPVAPAGLHDHRRVP